MDKFITFVWVRSGASKSVSVNDGCIPSEGIFSLLWDRRGRYGSFSGESVALGRVSGFLVVGEGFIAWSVDS